MYEAEVTAIQSAEASKPAHHRRARWAIEADVACAHEGHPQFFDARCVRCRTYEPAPIATTVEVITATTEAAPCELYTRDQGCPLHGETCAPEYR